MKKINQEESSRKNTTKPLTALVLLATLKPKNQLSHTAVLAKLLIEKWVNRKNSVLFAHYFLLCEAKRVGWKFPIYYPRILC